MLLSLLLICKREDITKMCRDTIRGSYASYKSCRNLARRVSEECDITADDVEDMLYDSLRGKYVSYDMCDSVSERIMHIHARNATAKSREPMTFTDVLFIICITYVVYSLIQRAICRK